MWSECESIKSSTWKELTAIKHILISMIKLLKGKRIQWFTDNQNVVSRSKDSMRLELQAIALCIFQNCVKNNVSVDVEWVLRTDNDH